MAVAVSSLSAKSMRQRGCADLTRSARLSLCEGFEASRAISRSLMTVSDDCDRRVEVERPCLWHLGNASLDSDGRRCRNINVHAAENECLVVSFQSVMEGNDVLYDRL